MKKQIFTFILTLITAFGVIAQTDSQDTQAQEINKMNLEVVRLFSEKKYSEALPIAKRTIEDKFCASTGRSDLGKGSTATRSLLSEPLSCCGSCGI